MKIVVVLLMLLGFMVLSPAPVAAISPPDLGDVRNGDGSGYWRLPDSTTVNAALPCGSYEWVNDEGKSKNGFFATATDGCHTQKWESTIAQGPASGSTTFKTKGNEVFLWLNWPGGVENYCKARAMQEADGYMTNKFGMPVGTEVTVTYRCD